MLLTYNIGTTRPVAIDVPADQQAHIKYTANTEAKEPKPNS